MAVTQKSLRAARPAHSRAALPRLQTTVYAVTLVLAAVAIYAVVGVLVGKGHTLADDLRYGRPRTDQLDAFVGHGEANGQPTHLMAINLNRQVTIIELPGGDAIKARTFVGPYLFGAEEDLTPPRLDLRDMDGDGNVDLILDIRNEQLIYLNKQGTFRLPTPDEQISLGDRSSR
jgi:hypothetical protein